MSNQSNNQTGRKKNSGYIIANDRANDRQPHFRGKVTVEGKEFLVSAWRQEPRDGKEMFSIELTDPATLPARPGQSAPAPGPRQPAPRNDAPAPTAAPRAPQAPSSDAGSQAFDDIFGGDGNQW